MHPRIICTTTFTDVNPTQHMYSLFILRVYSVHICKQIATIDSPPVADLQNHPRGIFSILSSHAYVFFTALVVVVAL